MSVIRNIPYESRMLAFVYDSIPCYSDEKNNWLLISKKELANKIKELQKDNNKYEISELLDIASDPELKINSESKNKSIRLNLDSSIKLMHLALKNKKTKTDIFKTIVRNDLINKIDFYSNLDNVDNERISHLKKISNNWLKIKQDQIYDDFSLSFMYAGPDEEIANRIIDFEINNIWERFRENNVPEKGIIEFFSLIKDRKAILNQMVDFGETHEITIELIDKKPYLVLKFYTAPPLPLIEYYNNYHDFINDIPEPIKPLLDKIFDIDFFGENLDQGILYVNSFNIFKLKVSFSSDNKLLLEGAKLDDDKFVEKVLPKVIKNNLIDIDKINKQIVDLTIKGEFLKAKSLQNQINEYESRKDLFEYYLGVIKNIPSQVFSFSIPKNLLLLLDYILFEKNIDERIHTWENTIDEPRKK